MLAGSYVICGKANIESPSVKRCEITLNLTVVKKKGSICSFFFSPKRKVTQIENEQLSKGDVEGEREGQKKWDEIQGNGDQGQEEVGERHSAEEMEEAESGNDDVQGSEFRECLIHQQPSPVELVLMTYPSPGTRCQRSQCETVSLRHSREEPEEASAATAFFTCLPLHDPLQRHRQALPPPHISCTFLVPRDHDHALDTRPLSHY
ncbi:uncharacterized protein LOC133404357 isoform X2 [Phycodurus eques]|uniref:uncharacterized protein LOC133404357 isoform X2 n=1 Tax=Phycodurus eques TaxID=693459 RepID=UPI002ACE415E|nr:uncharacterized protein LOC133404357 isoform X2 [Phycodurus eques]